MLVDRILLRPDDRNRVIDSAELGFRFGGGRLDIWINRQKHLAVSSTLECAYCGTRYTPPQPNLFSFNSPIGACETCRGFGRTIDIDLDLVIPEPGLSIAEGAVKPWGNPSNPRHEYDELIDFCRERKIPVDIPFQRLNRSQKRFIIEGTKAITAFEGFSTGSRPKPTKCRCACFCPAIAATTPARTVRGRASRPHPSVTGSAAAPSPKSTR